MDRKGQSSSTTVRIEQRRSPYSVPQSTAASIRRVEINMRGQKRNLTNGADRIEDRARPFLVFIAWAFALPIGAITAVYYGHDVIGSFIALNAITLGWCDV